jgi:hypothetical protein
MTIIFLILHVTFVQQRCSSSTFYLEGFLGSNEICYESENVQDNCPARDYWFVAAIVFFTMWFELIGRTTSIAMPQI